MMRDFDAITDGEILSALAGARVGAQEEPLHLHRYQANFDRKDTRRRAAFRVWAGNRVAFHLTIGPALGRLHERTASFARENPEIACKPLFFFRDREIDFFGQEYFGEANLEDGLANRQIDGRGWQDAVASIRTKLAATAAPSTFPQLLAEIDAAEREFMAVDWFGPLDQAFAQAAIFPLIRQGATSLPLLTSWTNGDFVAKNILFDGKGGYRLIDCEFAARTHFGLIDWFRLRQFSRVPGGVDLAALSGVAEWPKWLEMLGWLQHALRLNEVGLPHLVGGDFKIIAEKIARLSETASALARRSIFVSAMMHAGSSDAGEAALAPDGRASRDDRAISPGAAPPAAQLFWLAGDGYSEEQSARQPVPVLNEWTELSFDLPALPPGSILRYDPSDRPGCLEISKIEIVVPGPGSTYGFAAALVSPAENAAVLTAEKDCVALPGSNPLRFVMFGTDPVLKLPPLPKAAAGHRARLVVTLQISTQVPLNAWCEVLRMDRQALAGTQTRIAEESAARIRAEQDLAQVWKSLEQANQSRARMEQALGDAGTAIRASDQVQEKFVLVPKLDNEARRIPRRLAWWHAKATKPGEYAPADCLKKIYFGIDSPSATESQPSGKLVRIQGWFFDARLRPARRIEIRLGDQAVVCQPYARNDVANRFRKLGKLPPETGFSAEIQTERAFDRLEIVAIDQAGNRFLLAHRLLRLESAACNVEEPALPPVSLIIPSLNGGELFRQCLQGIRGQDYPADVQLLIIDSGSNDGTDLLAESFGAQVVRIKKGDFHHSRTRQMALAHARHNFVAYLVQDAIPEDDTWLQNMVRALLRNPAAVACYGRQEPHYDAYLYARFESAFHNQYLGDKPRLQSPPAPGVREDYAAILYRCRFDNVCALYRRSALNDCPFPDIPYGEDMAWAKAVLDRGWSVAYEPAIRVRHSHNRPPEYRRRRGFVDTVCCSKIIGMPSTRGPLLSTAAQFDELAALADRAASLDIFIQQRGGLKGTTMEAVRGYLGRPAEDPVLAAWGQGMFDQIAFILTQIGTMFPGENLAVYRQCLQQVIASAHGTTLGNIYANHSAQGSTPDWVEQAVAPLSAGV